jgi:hypothetical protein
MLSIQVTVKLNLIVVLLQILMLNIYIKSQIELEILKIQFNNNYIDRKIRTAIDIIQ